MIPGVGEFTAQFMSYTYARKTSKKPDEFGKGSPEGLIASEAANNAVPGAAMVPLLALGIPGEALTAMMMSVFKVCPRYEARHCRAADSSCDRSIQIAAFVACRSVANDDVVE